jgi:hypothetical protein
VTRERRERERARERGGGGPAVAERRGFSANVTAGGYLQNHREIGIFSSS